ncbi:MAG: hypothetical protein Q7J42_16350 [Sulfuritalea sp.]|nr:hypothetical protein [Sulfuritalea sp.]
MITPVRALAHAFALTALLTGPSSAAENVAPLKDLTAVITLLGLPCEQVVSAMEQAGNGLIATCKNGLRYRIFVNAEGRVVAQKL